MRHANNSFQPNNLREISLPKPLSAVLLFLTAGSLITRWFFPAIGPVIMDEFVDTQLACQLAKGVDLYYDGSEFFRMPFLEILLSWFCDGTQDGFATVVTARRVMVGGSMIIMLFTYLTARRVFCHTVGLLSLFMLCTYTTFLDHSFHVRADLVSTMFASVALFSTTLSSGYATIIAGVFLGLAFMTTQKAIYFVIAFAAALIFRSLTCEWDLKASSKVLVKEAFLSIFGMSVCVGVFFVYIYFNWEFDEFFNKVFADAFEAGIKSNVYRETWKYFGLTMIRNPLIWVLGVYSISFAMIIPVFAQLSRDENRHQYRGLATLGAWGVVQLFFTAYHTVKFPYFFLNISPILAIASAFALAQILSSPLLCGVMKSWQKALVGVTIVFVLAYFPGKRHIFHLENTDKTEIQKTIIDTVESITIADDAVLDGVGMAVNRKKATPYSMTSRWHERRLAGQYGDVLQWIEKTEPKVFIYNYRSERFSPAEQEYIFDNFIHYWANIWVAGKEIDFPHGVNEMHVELVTNSEYAIVCDDISKVLVDGNPAKQFMHLESGFHLVQVEDPVNKMTMVLASAYRQKVPNFPDKIYHIFPTYDE